MSDVIWSWKDIEPYGPNGYIHVTRITTKQLAQMIAEHKTGFFIGTSDREFALVQKLSRELGVTPERLLKDFIFMHYGIYE